MSDWCLLHLGLLLRYIQPLRLAKLAYIEHVAGRESVDTQFVAEDCP